MPNVRNDAARIPSTRARRRPVRGRMAGGYHQRRTAAPPAGEGPSAGNRRLRLRLGDLRGVTDAGHGADQGSVLAHLRAKAADVDVHRPRLAEVTEPPDLVEELLAGKDPARPLQQILEQTE